MCDGPSRSGLLCPASCRGAAGATQRRGARHSGRRQPETAIAGCTMSNQASTSASDTATAASPAGDSREEYLQSKYGSAESHVALSKQQVERVLDHTLEHSGPVRYMLESLKMVSAGRAQGAGPSARRESPVRKLAPGSSPCAAAAAAGRLWSWALLLPRGQVRCQHEWRLLNRLWGGDRSPTVHAATVSSAAAARAAASEPLRPGQTAAQPPPGARKSGRRPAPQPQPPPDGRAGWRSAPGRLLARAHAASSSAQVPSLGEPLPHPTPLACRCCHAGGPLPQPAAARTRGGAGGHA